MGMRLPTRAESFTISWASLVSAAASLAAVCAFAAPIAQKALAGEIEKQLEQKLKPIQEDQAAQRQANIITTAATVRNLENAIIALQFKRDMCAGSECWTVRDAQDLQAAQNDLTAARMALAALRKVMLSKIAQDRLNTVDPSLREIIYEAEEIIPLTVLEGHRGQADQEAAFVRGATKLHWPHGKHNAFPSLAVDLAPLYYQAGAKIDCEDLIAFGRIMGVVQAIAHRHGVKLRFGLDWDGDFHSVGRDPDESFLDAPHVERVVTKEIIV